MKIHELKSAFLLIKNISWINFLISCSFVNLQASENEKIIFFLSSFFISRIETEKKAFSDKLNLNTRED